MFQCDRETISPLLSVCLMFVEKLSDVRGDLVQKIKVHEALLSYMPPPFVTRRQKTDIQRVRSLIMFCDVIVRIGVSCLFFLFDHHSSKNVKDMKSYEKT